ncbi:hypothetical protein [Ferrimonas balearica]|uniref:hypothetical protein n=1 Tax=Ferrimonas balearica TaxID=44012 RepID=UPI001C59DD08|nr:hypothetical protein [Ferrimonas balearica]MBW3163802.1 hypothetical protein [Ferrimonas balearica]
MFGIKKRAQTGAIWSLEGGLYIARAYGADGNLVEQKQCPCLRQARDWLTDQGADPIDFHPSGAYFEMCGHDQ